MEYAILFLPLTASIISGFFNKIIGEKFCNYITCLYNIGGNSFDNHIL